LRGNRWRAWGSITDLATAKYIAQHPTEPRPVKFAIPSNLVGGYRWPGAPTLDPQTSGYIRRVEIGAVKVEAPDEQPTDDSEFNQPLCHQRRGRSAAGEGFD
jgi:hypothetical protein